MQTKFDTNARLAIKKNHQIYESSKGKKLT